MKIYKKNNVQNLTKLTYKRGISLIVLVITIIVILILAAAVILTINNNNPIAEANKARYESDRANMQAVFTLAVGKVMTQNRATVSITAGQINTEVSGVKETTGTVGYTVTNAMNSENSSGTIKFDKGTNNETTFYTGKKLPIYGAGDTKWYVDSEGNISLEVAGVKYGNGEIVKPPFSQTIASAPTTYYGEKVLNYNTGNEAIDNQVKWQIFYADTSNIYLIATDYVHYDLLPKKTIKNEVGEEVEYILMKGDTNYKAGFDPAYTGILGIYNGSDDIIDIRLRGLNKNYYEYLVSNNTTSGSNLNMKAVAYMMDIDIWSSFVGEYADYTIGGPTIELFLKSYSQKYNVDYRAQVTNVIGYKISKDGGTNWANYYSNVLNTKDSLYVISNLKSRAMWMASPSGADGAKGVLYVSDSGSISVDGYNGVNGEIGFRPIVCLNSNVTLKAVEGGYEIE